MSWDQSRSIPWSRIRQDGAVDPEAHKEQVFRELQREAREEEELQQNPDKALKVDASGGTSSAASGIPFSGMELAKQAAFGGCIGSITGLVFGFMDSMRTASESSVLANASNAAKGRYILQGATRSGALFGGFFSGFHMIKYGLRVAADPGDVAEIGIAGMLSVGALVSQPAMRPSIPYAGMLIIMDGVSIAMREYEKQK